MRKRYASLSGTITNNPLAIGGTSLTSAELASLPAVAAPDYVAIVLDPRGVAGVPEIVWVMAHTASATTATIWRARESTTARQHLLNTQWAHAPTPLDVTLNQNPFVYAPAGWDDTWIQAKYNAATTPAWADFIGMSFMDGTGNVTCSRTKNYARLIRDNAIVTQGLPLYGEFFDVKQSFNNGTTNLGYNAFWIQGATPSPWVYTSQPQWAPYGWNSCAYPAAASTPNWTFTTSAGIIGVDIIWWDQIAATAGSWGYNIDGGGTVTINTTAAPPTLDGVTGRAIQKRVTVTGLGAGVHTVNFVAQNVTGGPFMYIQGVAEFTSRTAGLGFAYCAYTGANILLMARKDAVSNPTDKFLAWQGNTKDAAPYDATFQFPTQPDLVVIEFGANDCADPGVSGTATGVGPGQFAIALQRLVDALRRGQPAPNPVSIVFSAIAIPGPDSGSCDYTGPSIDNPVNWPPYLRVLKQIAEEKECALVNHHANWGTTPVARGFCTATDFHPTDAGQANMAAALNAIL